MKKKISDISPKGAGDDKKYEDRKEKESFFNKFSFNSFIKGGVILIFVAIVVLGVWLASPLYSTAKIKVKPYTEHRVYEEEIEVNTSAEKLSLEKAILPGKIIKETKKATRTFVTTGKKRKGEKAKGEITIFNSYTPPRPITLIPNTKFLSSKAGKIFRTERKVTVPQASYSQGELVSGSVTVNVHAQKSGSDYNIKPAEFSVPELQGTVFYYKVWGESNAPMEGGYDKQASMVSQKDLEKAKEELRGSLKSQAEKDLKANLKDPTEFKIKDGAIWISNFNTNCNKEAKQEAKKFTCESELELKATAIKKSDLRELVEDIIDSKTPSGKEVDQSSIKVTTSIKDTVPGSGKIILDLRVEANSYSKIRKGSLLTSTKGKTKQQVKKAIKDNFSQVKEVKVNIKPFWVRKTPKRSGKIKIKITP